MNAMHLICRGLFMVGILFVSLNLLGADSEETSEIRVARKTLERMEKVLGPEDIGLVSSLKNLAVLYQSKGDFARAEPLYLRSLKIVQRIQGPADAGKAPSSYSPTELHGILAGLGAVQVGRGSYGDAETTLRKALQLEPNNAATLYFLGFAQFHLNKFTDALDALSRAAKLEPKLPGIQDLLGLTLNRILDETLHGRGDSAAAETALRDTIRLHPENGDAHYTLVAVYISQKPPRLEPAREHYRQAVEKGHARLQPLETFLFRSVRDPNLEKVFGARRIVAAGWKPSWSPDATRLAYARYPGEGTMVLDLASGKSTEVSPNGKDPAWSPDGRWIAFVRVVPSPPQVTGTLAEQVWLVETNGGQPRFLIQGGFPGWSSDSRVLYVHSRRENRIMSVPVNGPSPKPSVFYYQSLSGYPAVLPDGSRVAFGPPGKLIIVNPLTEQATRTWPNSSIYASLPAWSPDGKHVTFGSEDPLSGLWLGETETGRLTQLAIGPYAMPDWSRDGTKLAFDYRGGDQHEIWVIETRNLPLNALPPERAGFVQAFSRLSAEQQKEIASRMVRDSKKLKTRLTPAELAEFWRLLEQQQELIKQARHIEAIGVTRRLIEIIERTRGTNTIDSVPLASTLATLYWRTGNLSGTERLSNQILDLCLNLSAAERRNEAPLMEIAAGHFHERGDYVRAAHLLEALVALDDAKGGSPSKAFSGRLSLLADSYTYAGDFDRAEATYVRAVAAMESGYGKESKKTAICLDNFGILYEHRGEYDKSALLHERALAVFEKALGPEAVDTGVCLGNLAKLYENMGDFEKAERMGQRALEIVEKHYGLESRGAVTPLMNLAVSYLRRGYTAEAEPLFQLALRLSEKYHGPAAPSTAKCLNNLSSLYERNGRYTEAEQLYLRSLDIIQKRFGPEDPLVSTRLFNLAGLYWAERRPDKAEPLFLQALSIAQKRLGPKHPTTSGYLDDVALFYLSLGKRSEALDFSRKAEQADLENLATVLSFTSEQQRLAYQSSHQPFALFASLGEAGDLATAVFHHKGVVLDSLLEDRLVAQASGQPAQRALLEHWRSAKQQLMQLVLETAKEAPLESREQQEKSKTDLIAEVERLEGELARQVAGLGHARRALSVTVPQVQKAIPSQSVLLEFVRYPHFAEGSRRPLRGSLGDAELRYGAILLGSSGEPRWIPLGNAQAIEKNLQQYQAAVHERLSAGRGTRALGEGFSTLLQTLYQQLWAPIETALPRNTKTVILSPDGALNFCSFATLLAPDDRFLSQKYSIRYVSSGRDLLKTKPPPKSARLLIFAHPDFARAEPSRSQVPLGTQMGLRSVARSDWRNLRLPSLPGTAAESAGLAERAQRWGWPCQTYLAAQATEAELDKVESPRVLHLATHGFFLPDVTAAESETPGKVGLVGLLEPRGIGGVRPQFESSLAGSPSALARPRVVLKNPMQRSGLALAGAQATLEAWQRGEAPPASNDGIVTAEEVGGLNLAGTELVVLSACDTGAGQSLSGEGVLGLRRGFIQAGAQNLLLTLWAVDDVETARIMQDFYEAFHADGNASEALASVQRDWLVRLKQTRGMDEAVLLAGPFILSFQGEAK